MRIKASKNCSNKLKLSIMKFVIKLTINMSKIRFISQSFNKVYRSMIPKIGDHSEKPRCSMFFFLAFWKLVIKCKAMKTRNMI